LFIHDSHVVLRGAGKLETTLYFERPLEQSIQPAPHDSSSAWSWTGGQIFFISRERLALSKLNGFISHHNEGWLAGATLADVSTTHRGTNVLTVSDASNLEPGQMVLLEVDNLVDQRLLIEMSGNIPGASACAWPVAAKTIAHPSGYSDFLNWRWPVVVAEVLGPTSVRLQQPLRVGLYESTPARLRAIGPTLHESGVEHLTIENKLRTQTTHNINPGSNGVCFRAVYDCWAKNIHVLNADVAFGMTSATSCTLQGISAGGRSLHHFVACRVSSHDNLIENFVLEEFTIPAVEGSYLHGINLERLASGNVFRHGRMHTGTFDSHRQLPFENLRTDITITNKDAVLGRWPAVRAVLRHPHRALGDHRHERREPRDGDHRRRPAVPLRRDLRAQPTRIGRSTHSARWVVRRAAGVDCSFGNGLPDARDLLEIQRAILSGAHVGLISTHLIKYGEAMTPEQRAALPVDPGKGVGGHNPHPNSRVGPRFVTTSGAKDLDDTEAGAQVRHCSPHRVKRVGGSPRSHHAIEYRGTAFPHWWVAKSTQGAAAEGTTSRVCRLIQACQEFPCQVSSWRRWLIE
jgi:hypothetical protein